MLERVTKLLIDKLTVRTIRVFIKLRSVRDSNASNHVLHFLSSDTMQRQMKFGLGTLYSNPENEIFPELLSNLKIEMLSES